MSRPPDWVVNPLLSVVSLSLCFILLEIGCRVFPSGEYDELHINDPYYYIETIGDVRHHIPYYTYKEHVPLRFDTRGYYAQRDGIVCFHSNQFGARWIEPEEQKVGKSVIFVLGDSFAYGHGLYYEDTFAFRLQRILERGGHQISLLNFAERGADSREVLATYLKFEDSVPHEAVLYGLHLNDLVNFSTSSAITNLLAIPWIVKRSQGFEFLTERIERLWFRRFKIGRMISPSRFRKGFFERNMEAIVRLRDTAYGNNAKFTVILFPILLDLGKDTFCPLYQGVREHLAKNGIAYIDLTTCLEGYADEDVWILPFDQHPNEMANTVFTERLLNAFERGQLMQGIPRRRPIAVGHEDEAQPPGTST